MQQPFPGWLMGGMAALLAVLGLLSGWWPLQALGGLVLLVTLGYFWSERRARRRPPGGLGAGPEVDVPQPWRASAPPETLGERLLPAVFFLAAAVLVVAVALYTAAALGLW